MPDGLTLTPSQKEYEGCATHTNDFAAWADGTIRMAWDSFETRGTWGQCGLGQFVGYMCSRDDGTN